MANDTYPRLLAPPRGSFFLFGPRGTGKSTWIRSTYPTAHRIDLLNESLYQSLLADIGRFSAEIQALKRDTLIVVDEVQRLPALLNEVHRFIEEKKMKFILCGSSARKLRRGGVNLLAGRAERRFMHPLLPQELGSDFDLNAALRWGSLPVIWKSPDRRRALEAYVEMYLKEEIQAEAHVRNLPGFARFLPVAALFHGQVLNVAGIARDAGVARKTAEGFLQILDDTLITFPLAAYEAKLRVRERRHPKLYWVDGGLVRAVKRQLGTPSAEEKGSLFEGWVAQLLRAYRDYRDLYDEWYYWAPAESATTEINFLLRKNSVFVAIEVKAARTLSNHHLRGLRAIAGLNGLQARVLVFLGDRRMETSDGIRVLPVGDFLELVDSGTLFR